MSHEQPVTTPHIEQFTTAIFSTYSEEYIYYNRPIATPEAGTNLWLPVEVDTEFYQPRYYPGTNELLNTTISIQVRSIFQEEGVIFAHPDIASHARHPIAKHPCAVMDYLESLGHTVTAQRCHWNDKSNGVPILYVDVYAFFAVAELFRMFQGKYIKDVKHLCLREDKQGIEQSRRLRTYSQVGWEYLDYVLMPWYWLISGFKYRIVLRIFDTSAVHGKEDYKGFCKNSGVELKYKEVISTAEKADMLRVYKERPVDFDNYALGDLHNHDALMGNSVMFRAIYQSLGIEAYFAPPKLTIGSTVSKMLEAVIKKTLGVDLDDREEIRKYSSYACADNIKKLGTTGALNAKVDGGRCRNNRPTHTYSEALLVDIDIAGCYGEGLRSQDYPLGTPVVIDYPLGSKYNEYLSLRAFRTKYERELVPGLWQARVSTKEGNLLKYKQDFLISWLPPKDLTKMSTDTDFEGTDEWWSVDNTGETRIYQTEIHNAIITHDFLQWLDNIATVHQRKEYLDELFVVTAMFYPASSRVESVAALRNAHDIHEGRNTTTVNNLRRKTTKIKTEQECHAWYAVNLGDLIVTKLLLERKKHPKKTPFNDLYKLCTNTVYGDMVSPFFKIGNVVVGNNITARARAMAWYLEKGLFGWQSITDGCVFDLNHVPHPRNGLRVTGLNSVDTYDEESRKNGLYLIPLATSKADEHFDLMGYDLSVNEGLPVLNIITGEAKKELSPTESLEWVNTKSLEHLQSLFPEVDVLHKQTTDVYGVERKGQFSFEAKGFFESATFHGTANYSLRWNGEDKIAMRSYSKRSHIILTMNDEIEIMDSNGRPATTFLTGLRNPLAVERAKVYIKSKILKVGDYRRHYTKWMETEVLPGMNVETAALLREFSLSQFTFLSHAQYSSWRREYERLLRKYGQSYEMFFLNADNSLNYQLMVETIYNSVREGKNSFFDGMNKADTHRHRNQLTHIEEICLNAVNKELSARYINGLTVDEEPSNDVYTGKSMIDG